MTETSPSPSADPSGSCPSTDQLRALVLGDLPDDVRQSIEQHAATCEVCRTVLAMARLEVKGTTSLTPHIGPSQETVAYEPGLSSSQPMNPYSFLLPPEGPDEIGRLGGYSIKRMLGEGGMGIVFEAEDPALARRVAMKVLRPAVDDPSVRQRFEQEARLAASLASDRIVTIHQVGEDRGVPFIVMELLAGESLERRLARNRHLPLAETLRIARQVAEGLAVAHARGMVHRDIKPANVWLERTADGGERVKLLDFGIARPVVSSQGLTLDGQIVGTPSYMCPEQACGLPLDPRSDLFSLGSLVYATLAGRAPFERANDLMTLRAVIEDDPPPLAETAPHVPRRVAELVGRLLAKEPDERPQSARQVVDEIRALESDPTSAGLRGPAAPSLTQRLTAPFTAKRLGWQVWAGAVAIVVALAFGAWGQIGYVRGLLAGKSSSQPPDSAVPHAPGPIGRGDKPAIAVDPKLPPIKLGVIFSRTGAMAASERPIIDAIVLATEEINAAGGLLGGRRVEPLIRDGKSDARFFAEAAEKLIAEEGVATVIGCWRSQSRKQVEAICRARDNLLIYPNTYEGLEQSPYVVYMGGAPNQQLLPAAKWAFAFLNKRKFFLVGTDGVYSLAAHAILKDELASLGATVVGEELLPLGNTAFDRTAEKVKAAGADAVFNTVSGISNIALFHALRGAGLTPQSVPVISFDVTEEELRTIAAFDVEGEYAVWGYFQSLENPANRAFVESFHRRFGDSRVVNDPMEAAYSGIKLWALAVAAAGSDRPAEIRSAITRVRYEAPEGPLTIDAGTMHAERFARIGQVDKDLEFDVVWTSPKPIKPEPFPPSRSPDEWSRFMVELMQRFQDKQPPATPADEPR